MGETVRRRKGAQARRPATRVFLSPKMSRLAVHSIVSGVRFRRRTSGMEQSRDARHGPKKPGITGVRWWGPSPHMQKIEVRKWLQVNAGFFDRTRKPSLTPLTVGRTRERTWVLGPKSSWKTGRGGPHRPGEVPAVARLRRPGRARQLPARRREAAHGEPGLPRTALHEL